MNICRPIYYTMVLFLFSCSSLEKNAINSKKYNEQYRPQIHFSPRTGWMNDPNGMVYFDNEYHLFYQYYPDSTVWGPMHWGHATSNDLVHWEQQPIALYPDSLGYIFSGSAVVDSNNTSGFGKDGKVPLIAIFTHHDPVGEKSGSITFQNQSIAYSLDEGKTWTKYSGNPVLKNPGIRDFRDPKVSWNEQSKKWIMTLATLDHITFYSSPDLKAWTKESEFGKEVGAQGGVWECPDLFPLNYDGEKVWVLIVNLNPGGPNGGSATQYFTGQFDGKTFTPYQTDTRWIDYGPDEYAGITWSNTGNRKIFIGWMSNWQYANIVPTVKWRSAFTVPRELNIEKQGEKYLVTSLPVKELGALEENPVVIENTVAKDYDLSAKVGKLAGPVKIELNSDKIETFSITLSNTQGEKLVMGYNKEKNSYYVDRTKSGKIDFEKGFGAFHYAPRLSAEINLDMTMIVDDASVELFADKGLTVMTEIFFPKEPYEHIQIQSPQKLIIKKVLYTRLSSIWQSF